MQWSLFNVPMEQNIFISISRLVCITYVQYFQRFAQFFSFCLGNVNAYINIYYVMFYVLFLRQPWHKTYLSSRWLWV